ncbi:MAG: helix-hairpin-helix domain-containing protein, partial [Mollicutes bacterium]|nr:helix-hairpin-helix domain-containing protein [Mollicutes bacterium]
MDIIKTICKELSLKENQVINAIKLIDEGNTIPFIARYRKEATNYLTDNDLRNLNERLIYLRKLSERVDTCLRQIEELGKLTDELKTSFENASTLNEVEDLYRPYKPKRKTRASIAKEKGLEPLSNIILLGKKVDILNIAKEYIDEEKGVLNENDALNGAKDIISEIISDNPNYRFYIKKYIINNGIIVSSINKKDEKDTYEQYYDYKEKISTIPPHRILAIYRGERENCLKVKLSYELETIFNHIYKDYEYNYFEDILKDIINDSLKRLILPSVENEIRSDLFIKAEDKSMIVFKKNLRSLLMYPPLKNKKILGFDPGFRTGCKYALVNEFGIPSLVGVSFITSNSKSEVERSKAELVNLFKNNKIDYIALGNGTASRESEQILSNIIKENNFKIEIIIVDESGASVYSASKLGESEFPSLSVEKRSAISLARRAQDPLSELVKIDPKSIGVGQYQHDMDQNRLNDTLSGVIEDCVNEVGVNLNNASVSLLKYVSGISLPLANNIYEYLKTEGRFNSRFDLLKVKKMGPKSFEQCAGFLRIYEGSEPLDTTNIHPESYKVAKRILNECNIDLLHDS